MARADALWAKRPENEKALPEKGRACQQKHGSARRHASGSLRAPPNTAETRNSTKKTKNRIFAAPTAVPATVVKPNRAAIRARTRKVIAQLNMMVLLCTSQNDPSPDSVDPSAIPDASVMPI